MTYKEMVAYDSQREAQRAKMPRVVPPVLNAAKTSPLTKNTSSGDVLEWNVKLEEYKK
jgi:hypothetical protein